jgi:hypothetical protein
VGVQEERVPVALREGNLYTVLGPASCFSPLFYSEEKEKNKRFAQYHVGNTVTSTSFIPILAFTTTDAFLANINWRYTTVLHAP